MNTKLFSIIPADVIKGAITALFGGAALALFTFLQQPGFDLFTADWGVIGTAAVNGAVAGFVGYISKNFLSETKNGEEKVLGVALPQPVTEE